MIFFLENKENEIEKAVCGGMLATFGYVRVEDTGNGLNIFISDELRCSLDYAEMSRVEACFKMLGASGRPGLLEYWKVHKGEKI